MSVESLTYEKGLPANLDAERFVLGSILLNDLLLPQVAAAVSLDDFSLEKHRRIFARMLDLSGRGELVDRITVANELMKQGQLESVDGLGYLVSLDDGLPEIANLDAYVGIVSETALRRKLIFAHQRSIEGLLLQETSVLESIDASEQNISKLRSGYSQRSNFVTIEQIIESAGGMEKFLSPESVQGIPSPWGTLNEMLNGGGFTPGSVTIVGGRPASGKTALGTNIALFSAAQGFRTFYVSLEMTSAEMLRRMISAQAQVNLRKFRYQEANKFERHEITNALGAIRGDDGAMLEVWHGTAATVMALRAELRRRALHQPIGMLVVDYIQLMSGASARRSDSRNDEISEISRGLKLLTMELKCASIVLSQLSRDSAKTGKEPDLHDLRDSGSLEQDADNVMFPYAKPVDVMPEVLPCELLLRKQRNGDIGRIPLDFVRRFTRFNERRGA